MPAAKKIQTPQLRAVIRPACLFDIAAGMGGYDATTGSMLPCWSTMRRLNKGAKVKAGGCRAPIGTSGPQVNAGVVNAAVVTGKKLPGHSRSSEDQNRRADLLSQAAKLKVFVIVLEEKGGVGKSVTSQTFVETLKILFEDVLVLDADFVNKNLSRAGMTNVQDALDTTRVDFEGFLFDAADRLVNGLVGAVVIDSGAGGEKFFRPHLAELASFLRNNSARLVVVRPITTSPLVHDNLITFVDETMTPDMGVMLVRNLGQGRSPADYVEFDNSPEYRRMRGAGLVECILESAGARYSDLATSFGKSFAQIATQDADQLGLTGRNLEIARRVSTRPVRLFLARWLFRQTEAFRAAIAESLVHTL